VSERLFGVVKIVGAAVACSAVLSMLRSRTDAPASPVEPYATWNEHRPVRGELAHEIGAPRPGVERFRDWVLSRFGGSDLGIWGDARHSETSDHYRGRGWDWGQPDYESAMALIDALFAEVGGERHALARRLGITYLIFDRVLYAAYDPEPFAGRPYTGADAHRTHIHVSFSPRGAMGLTSAFSEGVIP
jgi:hypothetical protein